MVHARLNSYVILQVPLELARVMSLIRAGVEYADTGASDYQVSLSSYPSLTAYALLESAVPSPVALLPRRVRPGAIAGIAIAAVAVLLGIAAYFILFSRCWSRFRCKRKEWKGRRIFSRDMSSGEHKPLYSQDADIISWTPGKRIPSNDPPSPQFVLPVFSKFATPKNVSHPLGSTLDVGATPAANSPSIMFTSIIGSIDRPGSLETPRSTNSMFPARTVDVKRSRSPLGPTIEETQSRINSMQLNQEPVSNQCRPSVC